MAAYDSALSKRDPADPLPPGISNKTDQSFFAKLTRH